jgi:hypothetical protein
MSVSGLALITVPRLIVGLYLHLDDPANAPTVALASSMLGVAVIFETPVDVPEKNGVRLGKVYIARVDVLIFNFHHSQLCRNWS